MKKIIFAVLVFCLSFLSVFASIATEEDFRRYGESGIYPNLPYEVFESGLIPNEETASKVGELYFRAVYSITNEKYFPTIAVEKDDKWFIATQTVYFSPHHGRTYYMCIDKFTGEVLNMKLVH